MVNNSYYKSTTISRWSCITGIAATVILASSGYSSAGDFKKDTIRFAVPPWPGVRVKTQVVSDILETLGYETKAKQLGTTLAFQGLANKDVDVYLAYWSPNMDDRASQFIKSESIKILRVNLKDAKWGIAVPDYVWKSGVHTVSDLANHKDKFNGTIYGIETGSVENEKIKNGINANAGGLSGWELYPSSTAIMLTEVKKKYDKKEPVAWAAWSPHWMIDTFHAHFLKDSSKSMLGGKATISTVVPIKFEKFHPNVAHFLRHFKISEKIQNDWVYDYARKKERAHDISNQWIQSHMRTVRKWLSGVKTKDGQSAIKAIQVKYGHK